MGSSKRGKRDDNRGSSSESEDDFELSDERLMVERGDSSEDLENSDASSDDMEIMDEYEDEDGIEEGDEEDNDDDDDGEGGDNMKDEMEKFEKEYMDLQNQEQDILKNLKKHKDEDLQKGEAVKNQKALWNRTLELRFLLQKPFCNSNRLPQESVRSSFCNSSGVNEAYVDVINSAKETLDSILELQEALLEKNPSIAQATEGNSMQHSKKLSNDFKSKSSEDDIEWVQISQMHKRLATFRDKSVDKWQRKTQVTTGVAAIKNKLQAFNQNISDQVSNYMRDPSRMLKQMQQRRSTIGVFGLMPDDADKTNGEIIQDSHSGGNQDGDPDLLDDTEFYQQLLKEFLESVDLTSSEATFYAAKRSQNKKRKAVDRRASKSRKIRYNVHEKIVNFMAPQPMNIPPMAPKLFENLFGLKKQRPASVA
ncbi:hypothetical protein SAY87_021908 [Trapa incisa]|uniref:Uncharacterized protein n=1 Tax=Trapa incisa TaxID=236973 RepID=A0AAN7PX11_9MYRT|nr:hypothetical protein SAY87_021908 [Trapa incisa]